MIYIYSLESLNNKDRFGIRLSELKQNFLSDRFAFVSLRGYITISFKI
ncbi:hypothetical protein NMYAN_60138 [Nitrosomonas nitrosa]|uniref:Uncharacterized protein n=1 Tax=Nitrosomonas nitrosa TaxID=52442 RepID=A0A8H9DA72_9PROT|nr:hypothetical protein NMYAN_60138 [Nitrosomonas nitrosa]